ncbi:MAG: hypothetical protein GY708_05565 [Actinomycetia bacterium]|nr:hypothetical protein [Actinomycetes bacterium]
MPADEKTRLRIRQYLTELIDEEAADAMMESMPPIAWTELATKADVGRLDGRLDTLTLSVGQNSSDIQELTRTVSEQGVSLGARIDGLGDRLDQRIDDLGDRLDRRIDGVSERLDSVCERMDGVSERMDSIGARMDDLGVQMGQLGRAVTIGAATMALTIVVFMIGTIASLIVAGTFG